MGIIAGIMALSVVIAIHELGHLLMAKVAKVGVRVFSIGIGPKLFAIRYRETVYRLSAILIGGYVVLRDEEPDADLVGGERSSASISAGTRALISVAGPGTNVLLAALLVVGLAPFTDSPFSSPIGPSNDTRTISRRQGLIATIQPKVWTGTGDSKSKPVIPAKIAQVETGSPAEAAGLQRGDRIIAIDGKPIKGWDAMARHIRRSPGRKVTLMVERDGRRLTVELVPRPTKYEDLEIALIGISASPESHERRVDFLTALAGGIGEFGQLIRLALSFYGKLIRGEISHPTSVINGPLFVIWMVSEEAAAGIGNLLYLKACFSIGMAIVNILPIPLLDGGRFLFAVLEAVRRKPCTSRTRMVASHIGLGVVGALILLAAFNDVVWLFGGR